MDKGIRSLIPVQIDDVFIKNSKNNEVLLVIILVTVCIYPIAQDFIFVTINVEPYILLLIHTYVRKLENIIIDICI